MKRGPDQIEALAPEREALWTRLEKTSFLTPNEKREAAGYGSVQGGDQLKFSPPIRSKYSPDQPRDDQGQWTNGDGSSPNVATIDVGPSDEPPEPDSSEWPTWNNPDLVEVQARQPTRNIQVGSRTYTVTQSQEGELISAATRAGNALRRVSELDPEWRATPEISAPQSAAGAIASYRSLAQEAEARLQVIQRGNLPLGFNSHAEYRAFGREVWNGLRGAGYQDAEPYLRGSAVTGHNYRTGTPFDRGERPSDLDLAIVSPSMLRRAEELGVPMMGSGRTRALRERDLRDLGLLDVANGLTGVSGRDVTFMIYGSFRDIARRGPFVAVP